MIICKKKNWFSMLFVWEGSVLPRLLPRLTGLFLFSAAVVYYRQDLDRYHGELSTSIYTIFGIALAIFLGFRNTVSYDRFWEGRKLWGALLNDSRSLPPVGGSCFEGLTGRADISDKAMIHLVNDELQAQRSMRQLRTHYPAVIPATRDRAALKTWCGTSMER